MKHSHPAYGRNVLVIINTSTPHEVVGEGVIDGESRDKKLWWVRLDGHSSRAFFHKDFCKIIPPIIEQYAQKLNRKLILRRRSRVEIFAELPNAVWLKPT